jgi:hypothetical protein
MVSGPHQAHHHFFQIRVSSFPKWISFAVSGTTMSTWKIWEPLSQGMITGLIKLAYIFTVITVPSCLVLIFLKTKASAQAPEILTIRGLRGCNSVTLRKIIFRCSSISTGAKKRTQDIATNIPKTVNAAAIFGFFKIVTERLNGLRYLENRDDLYGAMGMPPIRVVID